MVNFDRTAFIAKFREEADEHLARLNEGIIELEGDPNDADLLDELFRVAHTLKGASKMVGVLDVSEVAHKLEDLLAAMRGGRIEAGGDVSDIFFEALDAIVFLADAAVRDEKADYDVEQLCSRLEAVATRGRTEETRDPAAAETNSKAEKARPAARKKKAKRGRVAEAPVEPERPAKEPDQEDPGNGQGDESEEKSKPPGRKKDVSAGTIRVKTAQVDKLLNLVGEIVISQIKSEEHLDGLKHLLSFASHVTEEWSELRPGLAEIAAAAGPQGDELRSRIAALDEVTGEMRLKTKDVVSMYLEDTTRGGTVVRELQEEGMQLRMLPVGTVFNAFPRAVRDMARDFNKDIKLEIIGADTELDKKVLEEISDPLVHIVRNSVDHGIESP